MYILLSSLYSILSICIRIYVYVCMLCVCVCVNVYVRVEMGRRELFIRTRSLDGEKKRGEKILYDVYKPNRPTTIGLSLSLSLYIFFTLNSFLSFLAA